MAESSSDIILNTGENATLIIGVTPALTDPLEEKYGTIVIQAAETGISISYRYDVVTISIGYRYLNINYNENIITSYMVLSDLLLRPAAD